MALRLATLLLVLVISSPALAQSAQSIAIEAHAGDRPADADRWLAPVYDELGRRSFRVGVEGVGKPLEEAVSRPGNVDTLDAKDIKLKLGAGIELRLHGDFAGASQQLTEVLRMLRANPVLLASNQSMGKTVFRAELALALAKLRSKDDLGAREVMADIVRTFPDLPITRSDDGPEAAKLYELVKGALSKAGQGTLTVSVDDPTVNIFINEVFAGTGEVTRELIPGEYRVYVQRGNTAGRLHVVQVVPGSDNAVKIAWALEEALHTSPQWTGIQAHDEGERQREVSELAPALARDVDAPQVAVLWFGDCGGAASLVGTVYDATSGKPLRSARVPTDPDPPADHLRALGQYLGGDSPSADLDVMGPIPECRKRAEHHGGHGWIKYTTGLASIGTLAAGIWLVHLDGKGTCGAVDGECPQIYDTAKQGYASIGLAAILGGITTYLFVHDLSKHDRSLAIVPAELGSGAFVTIGGRF